MAGKYGNRKCKSAGLSFDSRREAARYRELLAMQQAGEIADLMCQPEYLLIPAQTADSGRKERKVVYLADFSYRLPDGGTVVEDVKSPATAKLPAYIIKRKLMLQVFGIEVREIF